jgi:hypothetical protein
MIDDLTDDDLAAYWIVAEQDPELAEQLRAAKVRAVRTMAKYAGDPRSKYHRAAVEYLEPRKLHIARWLAANGSSTLK